MSGRDLEIVTRLQPEEWTEREREAAEGIEQLELSIFSHKLETTTVECQELLARLGASTGARWGDSGFAFYTAQGDISVCSTGIYFHAFLQQIPIKYTVKHWTNDPTVGVEEGDAFFSNDPLYGGVHAPDMTLFVPVFVDGELIAWTGAVIHTGECGANVPGGVTLQARSRYEEGLHVPPVKVASRYRMREDVLNMLANGVRDPRLLILDIKARLAACRRGEERLKEVAAEQGADFVIGGLRTLIQQATDAARARVAALPDATVRQVAFMDTVGSEDALIKLELVLTKKGDTIHCDLSNSSPEVVGHPANSFSHTLVGKSANFLCSYLFPDLPINSGLSDVCTWTFRQGTFVAPSPDAPISLAPNVMATFNIAFSLACAKLIYSANPDRAVAPWFNGFNMPVYGGLNQWGEPVGDIFSELNGGGSGGRSFADGVNVAGSYFATLSDSGEVEIIENGAPILYPFRSQFLPDSCGHGRHRGGSGMDTAYMVHGVPWVLLGSFGFGSKHPVSLGLFGGYASASVPAVRRGGTNLRELMANDPASVPTTGEELILSEAVTGTLRFESVSSPLQPSMDGDILMVAAGGGTGYGDVLERDPEDVVDDIRWGITSEWAAKNLYHVVYDADTFTVDHEATRAARDAVRRERLRKGRPLAEFEAEWTERQPDEYITRFYGAWPNPVEAALAPAPML